MADVTKLSVLADKKAKASWKNNMELHVALLMKRESLSKSEAVVQAYYEGVNGLNQRLG